MRNSQLPTPQLPTPKESRSWELRVGSWGIGSLIGAWIVIATIALELCGREVARRSVIHGVTGAMPSVWLLLVGGLTACAAAFVASRRRRSAGHPGAAPLFAALLLAGLSLQIAMGARLQSDGFYYYAYLRSLMFDRDVDFTNDYRMLGLGDKANLFQPTVTGHAHSAWTIGPAIVWSPFFGAAHLVALGLHAHDPNITSDGVS